MFVPYIAAVPEVEELKQLIEETAEISDRIDALNLSLRISLERIREITLRQRIRRSSKPLKGEFKLFLLKPENDLDGL